MSGHPNLCCVIACALGVGAAASSALAGDLAPPPGLIVPTDRMILSDATTPLPHVLLVPGSYVLTSDLTGLVFGDGLIIGADNIVIDCNGFTIDGFGSPGSGIGVVPGGVFTNITVRNGTVQGWGTIGIDLSFVLGVGVTNSHIENMTVSGNGVGIFAFQSTVTDCIAFDNAGNGIGVADESIVTRCSRTATEASGLRPTTRRWSRAARRQRTRSAS